MPAIKLGIDTGGTYTDAVLVDGKNRITASSKKLTTRHDLTLGIRDALDALPAADFQKAALVALSTTLSTNSVVEGRGAPVGILLPGYREQQVRKSGLLEIFDKDLVATLPGGHDAIGKEREPLDEDLTRQAIRRQMGRVSAFAVSSMFAVRNPVHEIRVRELIEEMGSRPVTCGHELASDLDAPRRALMVALNARMVLIIHELIIADMGGTTTDIAVVTGGQPELSSNGVLIGDWRPMVEAVRVISIGLGGDSEVRFSGQTGIEIGPRRVVPLSLLAHLYPETLVPLEQQLSRSPSRGSNRFAMRLEYNEVLMAECSPVELRAWEMLSERPLELDEIAARDREAARAIARLQRRGMAIYSGFTPSDAAHVLGLCTHWSTEAAELAALIEAGLHQHRALDEAEARSLTGLLAELVFESSDAPGKMLESGSLFHLKFAADYPVVAVGAPAGVFFPDSAAHLGIELSLPRNGEVANAFGAVMGSIVQRAHVTVTQPLHGSFIVHSDCDPIHLSNLQEAISTAQDLAENRVRQLALDAGARSVEIRLDSNDNHVHHDVDGDLFLETKITATAIGRPHIGQPR